MIYKINGEQPFQVLSDSFTVSPSESGYDLYLSADGFNYSNFASVGSGVTRQFTSMNNGNYYKLVGNTSIVSVNWERDCHGGGGGGTAGVASIDGQTGALTTKTINGNAILGSGDIVISGGTGGQKVIDLDALTQQELAALYTELNANSGVANMQYVFYATNNNTGLSVLNGKKFRYQILEYGTEIKFEVNMTREDATYFDVLNVHLKSDGTLKKGNNFQDLNRKASNVQLGQIKVGSGLTIDGNGVLSVSGGSDSSTTVKYLTEDTWPGAYWEVGTGEMNKWGASIRRPDYTEIFETYFNTNKCTVMGEGNLGDTGSGEGNLIITDENDHIMLDKQGNRYVFKMDFTNGILYFYHSPDQTGSFYYEGAQGAQYVTGSTTGTVHIELAKVLSGNTWIQKDEIIFPKTYFIDNMTDAERVELYNYIKYSGPKISPIAKYCRFLSEIDGKDGFMGMCEVYFCRFDSGTYLSFTGSVPSRNSDILFKVNFNLNPDGSIQGKTITEYNLTTNS